MRFIHEDTGLQFDLSVIRGTDFWFDRDGDLYLTDNGFCYSVMAVDAVKAILRRENIKNAAKPENEEKTVPGLSSAYDEEDRFNQFTDFIDRR